MNVPWNVTYPSQPSNVDGTSHRYRVQTSGWAFKSLVVFLAADGGLTLLWEAR